MISFTDCGQPYNPLLTFVVVGSVMIGAMLAVARFSEFMTDKQKGHGR